MQHYAPATADGGHVVFGTYTYIGTCIFVDVYGPLDFFKALKEVFLLEDATGLLASLQEGKQKLLIFVCVSL